MELMLTLVEIAGALPVLVTVTVCAELLWPTSTTGNAICNGLAVKAAGPVPVPDKLAATDCTPAVVLDTVSVPVRPPTTVGANSTCTVHDPPAANAPLAQPFSVT